MSLTSQQPLLANSGFNEGTGFFANIANSASQMLPHSAVDDGSGNVFLAMYSTSAFLSWVIKYNSTASSILVQKYISPTSNTGIVSAGITMVGTGGVAKCFQWSSSTPATISHITYWDTNLTLQFQRNLTHNSNRCRAYSIDSNGSNIAVCGNQGSTTFIAFVAQYDLAGTLNWQRFLSFSGQSVTAFACCYDTSGNIYVAGTTNQANASGDLFIAKYNGSGTIQWQKRLSRGAFAHACESKGIAADGSYVYVVEAVTGGGLIALNAADGSQAWWGGFGASTFTPRSVRLNRTKNELYVSGTTANASQNTGIICFRADNRIVKWQNVIRYLSASSAITQLNMGMGVNGDYLYLCAQMPHSSGTRYGALTRVPTNSALNSGLQRTNVTPGANFAYNFINYVGFALDSTTTYTLSNGTLTDAAGNMTNATPSYAQSTGVTTVSAVAL